MREFFRCRFALPISSPPIENAQVGVTDGIITSVDTYHPNDSPPECHLTDLGDMVVLPGFVNAHCHLELGAARDRFAFASTYRGDFSRWIRDIIAFTETLATSDRADGVKKAADSLLRSGVTTIADHVSHNGPMTEILSSGLKGHLFIELLGTSLERAIASHTQITHQLLTSASERFQLHMSPHSVHALHPDILSTAIATAPGLLSIHLLESEDEAACFQSGSGALSALIEERGTLAQWRANNALSYLHAHGLLKHPLLIVHGNTVTEADLRLLTPARHRFVHCPGSHDYFDHPRFPLELVESCGFEVAIGTDSWASNRHQDFLEELRRFHSTYPHKALSEIVAIATAGGARALMLDQRLGTLEAGKDADLIAFPCQDTQDPYEAVTGEFNDCLDSGKHAPEVLLDLQDGMTAGVTGTPAFVINGVLVSGAQPFEQFQAVIDQFIVMPFGDLALVIFDLLTGKFHDNAAPQTNNVVVVIMSVNALVEFVIPASMKELKKPSLF